jgi:ribulose-phosphate 3-epimerase
VHLMIERPERQVEEFARAGADSISVHFEATPHVHYALNAVREHGCLAGVALNPGTSPEVLQSLAEAADIMLCMTVNPGWGGQEFIPASIAKLERVRSMLSGGTLIEVDGGIDADSARRCANAGARLFVAGSQVMGQSDPAEAYKRLAESIGAS